LSNSADVLLAVRDGKVSGNAIVYLADAFQRAADEMRGGEWTEGAIAAADEIFALATGKHMAGFSTADAATLLKLSDTVAAETATTCDPRRVPVFVRPGEPDGRACPQVERALKSIAMALPAVAGGDKAPPRIVLLTAANESQKAAGHAEASQWSAASIAALKAVTEEVRGLLKAPERRGNAEAANYAAIVRPVESQAASVCASGTLQ
jgi:hypothetical protein